MEKIKPVKIELERVEGRCAKRTVDTYHQADLVLREWARTAPEVGYDKVEYVITFADESTYEGRFDLKYIHKFAADALLSSDVRSFIRFHTGEYCPPWMDEEEYAECIVVTDAAFKSKCQDFLKRYALED